MMYVGMLSAGVSNMLSANEKNSYSKCISQITESMSLNMLVLDYSVCSSSIALAGVPEDGRNLELRL